MNTLQQIQETLWFLALNWKPDNCLTSVTSGNIWQQKAMYSEGVANHEDHTYTTHSNQMKFVISGLQDKARAWNKQGSILPQTH